jgi:hypothetical protein
VVEVGDWEKLLERRENLVDFGCFDGRETERAHASERIDRLELRYVACADAADG